MRSAVRRMLCGTVDDEIRDEFAALAKKADSQDDEWKKRFEAALTRADEMIYKEANILFPNCAFNFTDEEWFGIYRDSKDYAECLGVENGVWEDAEKAQDVKTPSISQDEIVMAGGSHDRGAVDSNAEYHPTGDFVCGHRQYQPLF